MRRCCHCSICSRMRSGLGNACDSRKLIWSRVCASRSSRCMSFWAMMSWYALISKSSCSRLGVANSAAPVGVGALRSATKSAIVKSVSCPTPQITGISESAIAWASASSLKAHRSSIDPPPRTSNMTSPNWSRLACISARMIPVGASGPCTRVG